MYRVIMCHEDGTHTDFKTVATYEEAVRLASVLNGDIIFVKTGRLMSWVPSF